MADDDQRDRLAAALTAVATQRYNAGGLTFSQALDAAFDAINPDKRPAVTRVIYAQLFGAAITRAVPQRHKIIADPDDVQ